MVNKNFRVGRTKKDCGNMRHRSGRNGERRRPRLPNLGDRHLCRTQGEGTTCCQDQSSGQTKTGGQSRL